MVGNKNEAVRVIEINGQLPGTLATSQLVAPTWSAFGWQKIRKALGRSKFGKAKANFSCSQSPMKTFKFRLLIERLRHLLVLERE